MKYLYIHVFLLICSFSQAQKTELVVQTGHYNEVKCIAYSDNGKMVASGSKDESVIVYDAKTGLQMSIFRGFVREWIRKVQFCNKDKWVVSLSSHDQNAFLAVWDIAKKDTVYTLRIKGAKGFKGFVINEENMRLFIQTDHYSEYSFIEYDLKTGKLIKRLKCEERPFDKYTCTSDGKTLVYENDEGTLLYVHDTENDKIIAKHPFIRDKSTLTNISAMFVSADNKSYVRSFGAGTWREVQLADGKTKEIVGDARSYGSFLDYFVSKDKSKLIITYSFYISVFDVKTGKEINMISMRNNPTANVVAISPDGNQLVFGHDAVVIFMNLKTGRIIRETKATDANPVYADFNNSGKNIAITDYNTPNRIWNLQTADAVKIMKDKVLGQSENLKGMRFSPDDKVLFTSGSRPELVLLSTMESKFFFTHFYYQFVAHGHKDGSGGSYSIDNDFKKIIMGTDQYKFETGEFMCDFGERGNYRQRYYTNDGNYVYGHGKMNTQDSILVNVYETNTCKSVGQYNLRLKDASPLFEDPVVVTADGKKIISAKYEVTIADFLTGKNSKTWIIEKTYKGEGLLNRFRALSIDVNPQGTELAMVDENDNIIRIFSLISGKIIYNMEGHSDKVTSLKYSKDGKQLISTANDKTVKLWDPINGKLIATFISFGENDYVISTPDNYYMCSKGGLNAVGFRVGNKMFKAEQFDLRLNRPDTVLQRIGLATNFNIKMYNLAWKKRLQKAGYTKEMLGSDYNIPTVEVVNASSLPLSTTETKINLQIKVSDSLYFLDRYNVYVNDVPVYGMNGISLRGKKKKNITEKLKIELSTGKNKIQVSAFNEKGTESMRETFDVFCEKPVKEKPTLYLVAIGVSNYNDKARDLKFAAKDVKDYRDFMETSSPNFKEIKSVLITNEDATKETILSFKKHFAKAGVDDQVILYYSGHGLLDEQLNYYLATHNVDFNDPSQKGLSYELFEKMIDSIPCRNKLILIDACHSGEVDKEETEAMAKNATSQDVTTTFRSGGTTVKPKVGLKNSFALMQQLFTDVQKGTGATIISAAGGMEYALESKDWNNGVFTYCLLEGLKNKKADIDKDMIIRISELKQYVSDKVYELTKGAQTPTLRKENTTNDFVVH